MLLNSVGGIVRMLFCIIFAAVFHFRFWVYSPNFFVKVYLTINLKV